ncbi:hypothetical protein P7K49_029964 [Saguinus oedipus]|uniref:Uncharacterized protein n=1 Tax=Saguinus oedipus TaxID=9490 RepID=A0ABQ9U9H4_SAGOE|nr:hypothetical protein P7K49_029964 [Saguinus oedipus]
MIVYNPTTLSRERKPARSLQILFPHSIRGHTRRSGLQPAQGVRERVPPHPPDTAAPRAYSTGPSAEVSWGDPCTVQGAKVPLLPGLSVLTPPNSQERAGSSAHLGVPSASVACARIFHQISQAGTAIGPRPSVHQRLPDAVSDAVRNAPTCQTEQRGRPACSNCNGGCYSSCGSARALGEHACQGGVSNRATASPNVPTSSRTALHDSPAHPYPKAGVLCGPRGSSKSRDGRGQERLDEPMELSYETAGGERRPLGVENREESRVRPLHGAQGASADFEGHLRPDLGTKEHPCRAECPPRAPQPQHARRPPVHPREASQPRI